MRHFSIYPLCDYHGKRMPYPADVKSQLKAIAEAGFDSVCLSYDETPLAEQAAFARELGLAIENVHLSCTGMSDVWYGTEQGEAICDRLCRELRELGELGIGIGVVHATYGPNEISEEQLPVGLARFQKAVALAKECGVKLAIENTRVARPVCYLLDNIDDDAFGFCWDSGHENFCSPDIDFLSLYGDRLIAAHLHDNDGTNDMHWNLFHPKSTMNWEARVPKMKKCALFDRIIALEAAELEDKSALEHFSRAMAGAKKLADLLDA